MVATRQDSSKNFAGTPCALSKVSIPTNRDVIRAYYHARNSSPTATLNEIVHELSVDLQAIWLSVNSNLPLLCPTRIFTKLKDLLVKVKSINWNNTTNKKQTALREKLDFVFNICTCDCELPNLDCSDKRVKCKTSGCENDHITCTCGALTKFPKVDLKYLRDQRNKGSSQGHFQLGTIQRTSSMKRKRATSIEQVSNDLILCLNDSNLSQTL